MNRVSLAEFEYLTNSPAYVDTILEWIGGKAVAKQPNSYSSYISGWVQTHINMYLMKNPIGFTTGEQGGYVVWGERYAPDVAFVSHQKQAMPVREGYNPNPPDLAVEVMSPTDSERRLSIKIANYLAAGTVIWVVYPDTSEIEVYEPGQPVKILGLDDELSGGVILPDFKLKVGDILKR